MTLWFVWYRLPGSQGRTNARNRERGQVHVRSYERPTLTRIGSFKAVTGLGGSGPRDVVMRHQSL